MVPTVETSPVDEARRRPRRRVVAVVHGKATPRDGTDAPVAGPLVEPWRTTIVMTCGRARWFTRIGWAVTAGIASLLAFAYVLPQDLWSANSPYLVLCAIAFLVRLVQFHLGVVVLLAAGVAVIGRRRNLMLASLSIGLLATGPVIWNAIPAWTSPPAAKPAFRVMSLNLNANNRDVDAINLQVMAADPDVVVLQEFTEFHQKLFRPNLEARYPNVHVSTINAGVAVYSKTPLRISNAPQFTDVISVGSTRCEIEFAGRAAALYVVHLRRPTSLPTFRRSRVELARLLAYVAADPLPVIVAGDFNFTEQAPNAAVMKSHGLHSAHSISGSGFGTTRRLTELPVLRHALGFGIDHVFVGRNLTSTGFAVGGASGSDHLPVIVDMRWTTTPASRGARRW
jgi:endonuclease/exonuclease/phosphatase (EEP) superfamily protein YafD